MTGRIVSLLPAATEIACALGLRDRLVGRSHECDHPPGVEALPVLSRPRVHAARSGDIDRAIRARIASALSIYEVDAERLRELRPEVVLTQTLCDVCALHPRDLEDALADWTGTRPRIVSLEATRLEEVWRDAQTVADAAGEPERGRALCAELRRRVEERTRPRPGRPPRVLALEWLDPLMGSGHWMPELVERAGGELLAAPPGGRSQVLEWSRVRALDPDVLLVVPCGFSLAQTRRELPTLLGRPGFGELSAVCAGQVALLDGNQYFNRPGPRLVESLEILLEILDPATRDPVHRGDGTRGGWMPWRCTT